MDSDRIGEVLNEIVTDHRYIVVSNELLVVRSMSPAQSNYANFLYHKAYERGKQMGLIPEAEMLRTLKERHVWSNDDDAEIRLLEGEIAQYQKALDPKSGVLRFNKAKQRSIKNQIIIKEKELRVLENHKYDLFSETLEAYSRAVRNNFYVYCMVTQDDGTALAESLQVFNEKVDPNFTHEAIRQMNELPDVDEETLRQIARSSVWHMMWSSAKNAHQPLYDKPTTEYSQLQLRLAYWSMVYDSVYESLDRPTDDIINNDAALDKWLEGQRAEHEKDRTKRRKTSGKMDKHGEIFVMAETDDEADEILGLNAPWTRERLKKERARLEKNKGNLVTEFDLRQARIRRELLVNVDGAEVAAQRKKAARPRGFM